MIRQVCGRGLTFALVCAAIILGTAAFTWPTPGEVDRDSLLVADLRGHVLQIVSTHDGTIQKTIALPGGPHELLHLPDGRIAVSIEQMGLLALVEVETSDVELLEIGGVPHGLALDDDLLLVTDRSEDSIRRFELGTWRERSSISVNAWPHAVARTPAGALVVASAGAGTLQIGELRFETGAVTETVAVSASGIVATASAVDGTVHLFGEDGARLDRYEVGGRPVRVAFFPGGDVLAVALSAGGGVAVIEHGQVWIVRVTGVPDGLAFSADGGLLYVSDVFGGRVTVIDLAHDQVIDEWPVGEATGAILPLSW